MSRRIWLVILFAASLYLLGNGRVQLWDRDEPRYAQTSRQMLQSGDWVVPTLLDEPRLKKPPLIYWCQAGCMALMGDPTGTAFGSASLDAYAARLPSVIATILTLMLLGSTLARIADERRAFWAVLVMSTSGLVVMAAKMCLTDAVLLLFVTTSQLMLYAMWLGQRDWWTVTVFAAATGLALLTKGPVVLGINATTLVVLLVLRWWDARRDKRREAARGFEVVPTAAATQETPNNAAALSSTPPTEPIQVKPKGKVSAVAKIIYALLIIAAVLLPWIIGITQRFEGQKLWDVLDKEVVKRMMTPLEQHKGPPGYYLLFFFATFFPWCLLLPTIAKWAWRLRREPLVRFSLAAVVGPWIMFEIVQTKLPHYVLPCFPFLAILAAEVIAGATPARRQKSPILPEVMTELTGRGFKIAAGVWAGILVIMGIVPWIATRKDFAFDRLPYIPMVLVSIGAIVMAFLVLRAFLKNRIAGGALAMAGTMFVMFFLLFGLYLPGARFLHLSEEVGTFLRINNIIGPGEVQMIDYKEDSLPFYQGGTIRPQRKDTYLATSKPEEWPAAFVITREIWDKTPEDRKVRLRILQTFRGWAYAAKGRVVDVMVVVKLPG